jgi:hypothetical protein
MMLTALQEKAAKRKATGPQGSAVGSQAKKNSAFDTQPLEGGAEELRVELVLVHKEQLGGNGNSNIRTLNELENAVKNLKNEHGLRPQTSGLVPGTINAIKIPNKVTNIPSMSISIQFVATAGFTAQQNMQSFFLRTDLHTMLINNKDSKSNPQQVKALFAPSPFDRISLHSITLKPSIVTHESDYSTIVAMSKAKHSKLTSEHMDKFALPKLLGPESPYKEAAYVLPTTDRDGKANLKVWLVLKQGVTEDERYKDAKGAFDHTLVAKTTPGYITMGEVHATLDNDLGDTLIEDGQYRGCWMMYAVTVYNNRWAPEEATCPVCPQDPP